MKERKRETKLKRYGIRFPWKGTRQQKGLLRKEEGAKRIGRGGWIRSVACHYDNSRTLPRDSAVGKANLLSTYRGTKLLTITADLFRALVVRQECTEHMRESGTKREAGVHQMKANEEERDERKASMRTYIRVAINYPRRKLTTVWTLFLEVLITDYIFTSCISRFEF